MAGLEHSLPMPAINKNSFEINNLDLKIPNRYW
jgi:hypothetical protein